MMKTIITKQIQITETTDTSKSNLLICGPISILSTSMIVRILEETYMMGADTIVPMMIAPAMISGIVPY